MIYEMEELMPVIARLAEKYTSKESTSVSYDTARQLMEAVLYCIHECEEEKPGSLPEGVKPDCRAAYEEGYRIAHEKVIRAKELYHQIAAEFDDFGCRNYRDTVIKGMPAFFTKYDLRFLPQDHVLTLDYPVFHLNQEKKGIDLILDYLEETAYEQKFLRFFNRKGITDLLEQRYMDYQELYLDNICTPVLLRGAACLAADRDVCDLRLDEEGYAAAEEYFVGNPASMLERKLEVLFDILERNVMKADYRGIFRQPAHEAAVRLNLSMAF